MNPWRDFLYPKDLASRSGISLRQAQRYIRLWRDANGLVQGYPTLIQAADYGLIILDKSDCVGASDINDKCDINDI